MVLPFVWPVGPQRPNGFRFPAPRPAPVFAIPGQRPIRSHSLGQSAAAAQETAPKKSSPGPTARPFRNSLPATIIRSASRDDRPRHRHQTPQPLGVLFRFTNPYRVQPVPQPPRNGWPVGPQHRLFWAPRTWPAAPLWARLWERLARGAEIAFNPTRNVRRFQDDVWEKQRGRARIFGGDLYQPSLTARTQPISTAGDVFHVLNRAFSAMCLFSAIQTAII